MTKVYRDPRVMVGNWSEDRAEPLEGVLVDYGYRSYNTTSGDAFPVPSKSPPKDAAMTRAARMQRRGIRGTDSTFNMSQQGNVFEAMALSVNPGDGTGFTWRAPAPDRPVGQYSTTFGDTFGRFNGEPAVPDRPAGAKRKADRGRSATGMIGEVYVTHDEPGLDTRCQRVWLPNNDLIIDPADRGHVSSATLARG